MSKVYLVTQGNYSSYHVIGAFSTKARARAYVKKGRADLELSDECIEEVLLDGAVPRFVTVVKMLKTGRVLQVETQRYAYPFEKAWYDRVLKAGIFAFYTADQEAAIKTANEYRAILLAQDKWENPRGVLL